MKFIKRFLRNTLLASAMLAVFVASPDDGVLLAQTGVAPKITFFETDQTLPAGLWRIQLDGDVMTIDVNTAAANNFSAVTTAISIASNGDVTIPNDFFVTGSATVTVNTTVNGQLIVDVDNVEALLVRKDGDAGDIFFIDTNTDPPHIYIQRVATGSADLDIRFRRARASLATVVVDDSIAGIDWWGHDGTSFVEGAGIVAFAEGTIATTRVPMRLSFFTGTDAAPTVITERMRIDSAGVFTFGLVNTAAQDVIVIDGNDLSGDGQQDSGAIILTGLAFDSAAAIDADWKTFVDVTSNTGTSSYLLQTRIDGAAFATKFEINDVGQVITHAPDAIVAAPGFAYASSPDTGVMALSSAQIGFVANSVYIAQFQNTSIQFQGTATLHWTSSGSANSASRLGIGKGVADYTLKVGITTDPHQIDVYNTYTSATDHEFLQMGWIAQSNIATIWTKKGSGGGTARQLSIGTDEVAAINITTSQQVQVGPVDTGQGDEIPPELFTVLGNSEVFDITSLASESVQEGAFPTFDKWADVNDFDEGTTDYDYLHSTGAGTLTQALADLTIAGKNNRWYEFTYTISSVTAVGALAATITNAFAASAVTLDVSSAATRSVVFQSNSSASAADFVISATSDTASDGFTIDDVILKEVIGGDLILAGKITGGGTIGLAVDSAGQILHDDSVFYNSDKQFITNAADSDKTKPGFAFAVSPDTGFMAIDAARTAMVINGTQIFTYQNTLIKIQGTAGFGWTSTGDADAPQDTMMRRDSVGVIGLREGTNSHQLNVYNTYTSATVNELLELGWDAQSNIATIGTKKGSGGGTARAISIRTDEIEAIGIDTSQNLTFAADMSLVGNMTVTGAGPHAIGASTENNTRLRLDGAFTSLGASSQSSLLSVFGALTGANGDTSYLTHVQIGGSITTQGASEAIAIASTLRLDEPSITVVTATVVDSATLHIAGAASEGTTANYAILVDGGNVRFAGTTFEATGAGPHAIGGTTFGRVALRLIGTFTSDGSATTTEGVRFAHILTGASGDTTFLAEAAMGGLVGGAITTQTAGDSIGDVATLNLNEPGITNNLTGTGVITNASTLLITGEPTEGVYDQAILVDTGKVRFGAMGSDGQDEVAPETLSVLLGNIEIYDTGTLVAESLTDGAFPDSTNWAGATDWSDTISGTTTYTHSAGSGTLTQTSAQLAREGNNNRWYEFTYEIVSVTDADAGMVLTITTAFGGAAVTLDVTSAATRSVVFQSDAAADAANFVMAVASSSSGDTFVMDNVALREVAGGDVIVAGKLTGGGSNGLAIDGDGNLLVDSTGPHNFGSTTVHGYRAFRLTGTFTSDGASTIAEGFNQGISLVGADGDTLRLMGTSFGGTIATQSATESIANVAQVMITEPAITDNLGGGGVITDAHTLLITGAPNEGARNNALSVTAGSVRIGAVGTNDGHMHILSPGTTTRGLIVEMPASSSVPAQEWNYNGSWAVNFDLSGTYTFINFRSRDLGDDLAGPQVRIGRNTNVTNSNSGTILFQDIGGTDHYIWLDNSASPGDLRVHTVAPASGTTDLAGEIIGEQSSWHELKSNIRPFVDYQSSLDAIVETDLYSYDYKDRSYKVGYVIYEDDIGKWFSFNDDLDQQQTPSLKMREIIGTQSGAIKALNEKILRLEFLVEQLLAR